MPRTRRPTARSRASAAGAAGAAGAATAAAAASAAGSDSAAGAAGAAMFARYAHPPNELGYCGPADFAALATGGGDQVAASAADFDGAWPYLQVIGTSAGLDAVDERVVEAYWVGNDLLNDVDQDRFAATVDHCFGDQPGADRVQPSAGLSPIPHHSFHVFTVYPWVRMLADHRAATALTVLDRCRIRWGRVVAVTDDEATVLARPLKWDGRSLYLGRAVTERVRWAADGWSPLDSLRPGESVSMHWGWVCDRLTPPQVADLRACSARQLTISNARAPWAVGPASPRTPTAAAAKAGAVPPARTPSRATVRRGPASRPALV